MACRVLRWSMGNSRDPNNGTPSHSQTTPITESLLKYGEWYGKQIRKGVTRSSRDFCWIPRQKTHLLALNRNTSNRESIEKGHWNSIFKGSNAEDVDMLFLFFSLGSSILSTRPYGSSTEWIYACFHGHG